MSAHPTRRLLAAVARNTGDGIVRSREAGPLAGVQSATDRTVRPIVARAPDDSLRQSCSEATPAARRNPSASG
jgi:hypothetical protein